MKVIFYERPGCATNARQKQMLKRAGHTVIARSLLSESWTPGRLRSFFAETPVSGWFNRAAPRVKSGEIDPAHVEAAMALALMLADPLLIRRPLMEIEGERCVGFELEHLAPRLGLDAGAKEDTDPQSCIRSRRETPCLKEQAP